MTLCPCGSGQPYESCCEPFIAGKALPPTPEALMRSRYTAFTVAAIDYLHDTLAPEERSDFNRAETEKWARSSQWLGLTIHAAEGGAEGEDLGSVDFTAKFRMDGRNEAHREVSAFRRENGRWFYAGGRIGGPPVEQRRVEVKVGRNDPCPCGSGKKYKKCCGA